ncbi:MAG: hypothetical protein E4H36_05690 [Spirochaetales bacterium]|nr:MAG: hypothetical protein E4H36_05690 [Spirochaetales bacterium]
MKNTGGSAVYENLSCYLHLGDEDGIEDVEFVYIIHDGDELFWKLSEENWDKRVLNDVTWIGSNSILMADRSPLPRGNYRVIVLDKAGERSESTLFLSTRRLDPSEFTFPELSIRGSSFELKSPFNKHTYWLYSGDRKLLDTVEIEGLRTDLDTLLPEPERQRSVSEVWLYAWDDTEGISLVTGPFTL